MNLTSLLLTANLALLAAAGCSDPPKPRKVELVEAPPGGDVASVVRDALATAKKDGRDLLVYEGASWCEPCQRFHRAAASGALDGELGTLRLIVFDADRDAARLAAAGYTSRLIPLFARPNADGRSSGVQIEGSIKGDGAVAEIAPRLKALVQRR